jgi:peptidyl-prolyl cis-trans isomerase-like protein 2
MRRTHAQTHSLSYSWEAVEQLNLKPKHLIDLCTGEPFTRADLVTVQDPADWGRRQIDLFEHVRRQRAVIEDPSASASGSGSGSASGPATGKDAVRANNYTAASQLIIASLPSSSSSSASSASSSASASAASAAAAEPSSSSSADAFTGKRLPSKVADGDEKDAKRAKSQSASSSSSSSSASAPTSAAPLRAHYTTGAGSGSLTSTAQPLTTANQSRVLDDAEVREKRCVRARERERERNKHSQHKMTNKKTAHVLVEARWRGRNAFNVEMD